MSGWIVTEATAADRAELARFEEQLFGSDAALRPEWMFDRNPAGAGLVLVAKTAAGRIVGTRSVLPWDLVADGNPHAVGQYARSWTHPEFRRQGVSVAIGTALDRASRERGWPMLFIFPSDRSLPGHRRLGHDVTTLLERRQILLRARFLRRGLPAWLDRPLSLLQRTASREGRGVRGEWEPTDVSTAEVDRIWSGLAGGAGVRGVRHGAFVRWRYDPASGRTYQGWRFPRGESARLLAVTTGDSRVKIVDFWGGGDARFHGSAVALLVRELGRRGADFVEWAPPRSAPWTAAAAHSGLIRRRRGIPLARFVPERAALPPGLADLGRYALTEGDSDYA
jgi:GNAT superfamily N-acetyltransferase